MKDAAQQTGKQPSLPAAFALIALCPILVFCVAETILATLAHNAVPFAPDILAGRAFPEPGEAASRLNLLGLAFLVLVGAAGMVLKAVFDVMAYFSGPARQTLALACLLAVAVGAAFLVLMASYDVMRPPARLGDTLFVQLFRGVEAIKKPGLWSHATYQMITHATHIAVVAAIAAMITGSISCLATFPNLTEKENWKLQSRRLKTYATISAAFLIVSVFYFKSWAVYPAFLLAGDTTKTEYAQFLALANAYTTYTGIEYSLVLAAYTLPVCYFQSRAADTIARRMAAAHGEPNATLAVATLAAEVTNVRHREGLVADPQDILKLVLAIISPLVTGALTNLAAVVS